MALSRCKYDMGTLLWLNGKTQKGAHSFDRLVRCSVCGCSFMRLHYKQTCVYFVYVSAQKITVRLWISMMFVAKLKQEDQKHKYNLE